jgi:hypothetical protein
LFNGAKQVRRSVTPGQQLVDPGRAADGVKAAWAEIAAAKAEAVWTGLSGANQVLKDFVSEKARRAA